MRGYAPAIIKPTSLIISNSKTNKFENLDDITTYKLKFRPIIDETGNLAYGAATVNLFPSASFCYKRSAKKTLEHSKHLIEICSNKELIFQNKLRNT